MTLTVKLSDSYEVFIAVSYSHNLEFSTAIDHVMVIEYCKENCYRV